MILPEIVAAGIYNSQFAAKNTKISKNRRTSMFEIELPVEKGGVSYIDSVSKKITPDMIICAKPGQVRHTKFPFRCYYVHMILEKGTLYDTLLAAPVYFDTDRREAYKNIFTKLIKHYSTLVESDEIIVQSPVLELIYNISRDTEKMLKTENGNFVKQFATEKVTSFIKDNLTEDLSLESMAKIAHLSPIHFHNSFKTTVGKTLREYVEEQRLKKAINLITTTDHSLTKIAFECGFSSQSYFSYVFKRKMQKTPREYMKDLYNRYEI